MGTFRFDQSSMRKLERQLQRNLDAASEKANRAASREETPALKARAFAREMKRANVEMDERELRKRFER